MNATQNRLLPKLGSLNVTGELLRLRVPVHFIIGDRDPLVPASIGQQLGELSKISRIAVTFAPFAGHMVHFDRPEIVRSILMSDKAFN